MAAPGVGGGASRPHLASDPRLNNSRVINRLTGASVGEGGGACAASVTDSSESCGAAAAAKKKDVNSERERLRYVGMDEDGDDDSMSERGKLNHYIKLF